MPKIVDHDRRRDEIVAATMRVIGRIGLDATTVREIAKEAGYSNGVLAHYFANKQQILVMAHRASFAAARGRIAERTAGLPSIEALRIAFLESLPLDEQSQLEAQIDVSFWANAILDPELQRVRTASHLESIQRWTEFFAGLREEGLINAQRTEDDLATEIMILIDGMSAQAVLHPEIMTPQRQRRVVNLFVESVLP